MNAFNLSGSPEKMLASLVAQLREESGLTLKEMSGKLGISSSFLKLIESGDRCPKKEFAHDLAETMGRTSADKIRIEQNALLGIILYHFPAALTLLAAQGEILNPQARKIIQQDILSQNRCTKTLANTLQMPTETYLDDVLNGHQPVTRQQIYALAKHMNVPPQKYLLNAGFFPYEALTILHDSPDLLLSLFSAAGQNFSEN